jgi:hypothetical protein
MRECFDEGVLQSFNDGELPRDEAEQVSLHLTQCRSCFSALRELVDANELMTSVLAAEFESAVPTERLRRRIDAAIAANPLVTTVQPSLLDRIQSWLAPLTASFRQPALAYGGLAAIVLFTVMIGITYLRKPVTVVPDHQVATIEPAPEVKNIGPTAQSKPAPAVETNMSPTSQPPQAEANSGRRISRKRVSRPETESVAKVKLIPGEKSYLRTIAALNSTIKANDRPMRPALRAEYERNLALVDRALAAARATAKNNPDDPDAAEFVFAAYQSKVDLLNTVADARTYNRQQ